MKSKKLISVLCAVSMILSALPAASAAEPVSKYAGKTISVQVVEDTEDGMVSRIVEVAIPARATKSQETELVYAAAQGEEYAPLSSGIQPYATWDIISSENYFTLSGSKTKIGGGTLKQAYKRIAVSVEVSKPDTTISIMLRNGTDGGESNWEDVNYSQVTAPVYIVMFYKSNKIQMTKGTPLEVYARTTGNRVDIGNCTVQGSPNE